MPQEPIRALSGRHQGQLNDQGDAGAGIETISSEYLRGTDSFLPSVGDLDLNDRDNKRYSQGFDSTVESSSTRSLLLSIDDCSDSFDSGTVLFSVDSLLSSKKKKKKKKKKNKI